MMQTRKRVKFAIVALALIAAGILSCYFLSIQLRAPRTSAPAGRTQTALPAADRAELLERVLHSKDVDSLQRLLDSGGVADTRVVNVGIDLRLARPDDPEKLANLLADPKILESDGHRFAVVPAVVRPADDRTPGIDQQFVVENGAFIFDTEGNLDTVFRAGLEYLRNDVLVVTLGTSDGWFIWTRQSTDSVPPFQMVSKIFRLNQKTNSEKPDLLVRHYGIGDFMFTDSPKRARPEGSFILFTGVGDKVTLNTTGTAPDGSHRVPVIRWDASRHRFSGPSRVEIDGKPVYAVDAENSSSFDELKD